MMNDCRDYAYQSETLSCWTHGEWIHSNSSQHFISYNLTKTSPCEYRLGSAAFYSSLKWFWVPSKTCDYTIPDRLSFCSVLNRRNILIVGDSLNFQFAETINYFVGDGQTVDQWSTKPVSICSGEASLLFIRNDHLTLQEKDVDPKKTWHHDKKNNLILNPWIHYLIDSPGKFPVVILNRGAHYVESDILLNDLKKLEILFKNETIREKTLFLYRNTVSGHGECNKYLSPGISSVTEDDVRNNWVKFAAQNALVKSYLDSLSVVTIDANATSYYRPDSHVAGRHEDCLHYCMPGPVDTWVIFLFNILRLLFLKPHRSSIPCP